MYPYRVRRSPTSGAPFRLRLLLAALAVLRSGSFSSTGSLKPLGSFWTVYRAECGAALHRTTRLPLCRGKPRLSGMRVKIGDRLDARRSTTVKSTHIHGDVRATMRNHVSGSTPASGRSVTKSRRYRKLTAEEEIELVKQVQNLTACQRIRNDLEEKLRRAPTEEELATSLGKSVDELRKQLNEAQSARSRIVTANIGLIVSIAQKFQAGLYKYGISRDDVIQEGSLALLRAAETFDLNRGHRFSTYATWWVRHSVQSCVMNQARLIRLPQHVHRYLRAAASSDEALRHQLGRAPTETELAEHMDVDVEHVRRYSSPPETVSLDGPSNADQSESFLNKGMPQQNHVGHGERHEKTACSEASFSPEQRAEAGLFQTDLEDLMSALDTDERLVITLRYGLGGIKPTSMAEAAAFLGATTERLKAVEVRALDKLRRPDRNCRVRSHVFME